MPIIVDIGGYHYLCTGSDSVTPSVDVFDGAVMIEINHIIQICISENHIIVTITIDISNFYRKSFLRFLRLPTRGAFQDSILVDENPILSATECNDQVKVTVIIHVCKFQSSHITWFIAFPHWELGEETNSFLVLVCLQCRQSSPNYDFWIIISIKISNCYLLSGIRN